eukprot:TRINITY_DN2487_c0_g2_i3.p1 TRINITY_DN2487_c0_g2~~TRINITY_DN2487_c0_g2_i3.p1  ORF type:complete len:269 (+),score=59.67 TRINITY_DN2487_c0_g2_i3:254-1060(+)
MRATRLSQVFVLLVSNKKETGKHKKNEISDSDYNESLRWLAQEIEKLSPQKVMGVFCSGESNSWHLLVGHYHLQENCLGLEFRLSPGSFFQTNLYQAEKIYENVLEILGPEDRVIDAFCGVGMLTCLIAKKVRQVVGIECVTCSVNDARFNAQQNHVELNCSFIEGKTEEILPQLLTGGEFNVVLLNPPRTGVPEEILDILCAHPPRKILYISCNPQTLAWDIQKLSSLKYEIVVRPFDMFPQTLHVELLVQMILLDSVDNRQREVME